MSYFGCLEALSHWDQTGAAAMPPLLKALSKVSKFRAHESTKVDLHVQQCQAVYMPAAEDLPESLSRIRLSVLPALKFHPLLAKSYLLLDLSAFVIELGSWHDLPLS